MDSKIKLECIATSKAAKEVVGIRKFKYELEMVPSITIPILDIMTTIEL